MGQRFVACDREQPFLIPPDVREWLAPRHLAWFVIDAVAEMDLDAFYAAYRVDGRGRPAYDPAMMVALLLYAYARGVRSSRVIERACDEDVAFRVLAAQQQPDHATIARFVVDHELALEGLFVEGLRLCAAAGLCDLSVVAVDGTKIAADASLARNRDGQWIRREVAKLMALTGEQEQVATARADALPGAERVAESSAPAGRLGRLTAALAVVEAQDAAARARAARDTRAAAEQAEQGRQPGGRKPNKRPLVALARAEIEHRVAVQRVERMHAARAAKLAAAAPGQTPTGPPYPCRIRAASDTLRKAETRLAAARTKADQAQATAGRANITDPDSRIMPTNDGWVQGYNAQAIVNAHQIVLACDASQHAGDVWLYEPMNDKLTQSLTAAGITAEIELELADAGYCSEHNLTCPGPDRLIATTKDHKQRRAARELGHTNGPPPPDATPLEEMEHLLRTPQGHAAYKQRSQLIEPVFGDRKHNRQIRRFRRRGLDAVRSEWAFIHLAGNILKLYQHRSGAAALA